jgi:endonuclease YncB( thermonuclease family)
VDSPPPEENRVARILRRRRIRHRMLFVVAILAIASVGVGNVRQRMLGGNDWQRFDRQSFAVSQVISGDTIVVQSSDGPATVHLLGIDAPDMPPDVAAPAKGAVESRNALVELIGGRQVMLRLPQLSPRTSDGAIAAYLHVGGSSQTLNDQLIAAGYAFADRRASHTLQKQFDQAETEARKKKKGFWKEMRDSEQPAWRQEWLRSLKKQ